MTSTPERPHEDPTDDGSSPKGEGSDRWPARGSFWRRPAAVLFLAVAACEVLDELLGRMPCSYGEPLLLRWLRAIGEHPLRSGFALALLWGSGGCFALGICAGRA